MTGHLDKNSKQPLWMMASVTEVAFINTNPSDIMLTMTMYNTE